MAFFDWAAPLFHRFLDARWTAEDIEILAGHLRPAVPAGGSLLDLGGGTGGLATRMAGALAARITIVDPAPQMLARVPAHPALTARLGAAEAVPFPDGVFDAVLVSDAFHHFRDLDRAVGEMVRVTRPGGTILILEIDPAGWRRLIVAFERLVGEPAHFFAPEALCAFMGARGVQGRSVAYNATSYLFIGRVKTRDRPEPGAG